MRFVRYRFPFLRLLNIFSVDSWVILLLLEQAVGLKHELDQASGKNNVFLHLAEFKYAQINSSTVDFDLVMLPSSVVTILVL